MAPYRHMITWESITGMPEDRVVNVFHSDPATDAGAIANATALMSALGTVNPGAGLALSSYFGSSVVRGSNAHSVRTYDLADPEPRAPIDVQMWAAGSIPSSTTDLPREVCCALSFQAPPVSGLPQARRRGRVFWGPLNSLAVQPVAATGDIRPSDDFITDALIGLFNIFTDVVRWGVWSPTDSAIKIIEEAWLDNALDTQRRRGTRPTLKFPIDFTP